MIFIIFTVITVIYDLDDDFMTPKEMANMVRYYRKKSKLSQQELARFAGVGKTVVFDIEKGKETVQLNTLLKILDVLNIKMKFDKPFEQNTDDQL